MAKLVLITDSHFGVRQNSEHFHNNMELFYSKTFFPWLHAFGNTIDGIIHLGDVFDDRRKIDVHTAKRARKYFFEPMYTFLKNQDLQMHIICGNHDAYHRDDLLTTSLNEFIESQNFGSPLTYSPRFQIHTQYFESQPWDIAFVPWITRTNRLDIENSISRSTRKYLMGHLELSGFKFSKVQEAVHGDDPASFTKFKHVFSGHYHYPHTKGNITYLGSPTEQTWIDVDTTRGFYIFDTDTGEVELVENPYHIFANINYGSTIELKCPSFIRLHRDGSEKQSDVDAYIKQLYDAGAIAVDVIVKQDRSINEAVSSTHDTIDNVEETPVFIRKNVEDVEIANILVDLYNRAVLVN